MIITRFASTKNSTGTTEDVDVEKFLSSPRVAVDKRTLPLFSFGKFRGNHREGSDFESISMLGFDVDIAPVPDEAAIKKALERIGVAGYYLTSPSAAHSAMRWRLFIPTNRPINAPEYSACHAAVKAQFGFPVGQQAIDPTRAWYVPAQPTGGIFVCGKVEGPELDPDLYKGFVQPAPRASPAITSINLPPSDERHAALLEHLVSCWPGVGRRDECHMALAGTLAKLGYGPDYVGQVVSDLSEITGSDKGPDRLVMVRRTFEKLNSGGVVAAFLRLADLIGKENAEAISEILGLRIPTVRDTGGHVNHPFDYLPDAAAGHSYSYHVGDAPSATLRQATMSDLVTTLTDHVDWQSVLRWNTLSDTIVAINPPMKLEAEQERFSNADITLIRMWLEAHGIKSTHETTGHAIEAAAKKTMWNPLEVYLKRCGDSWEPGAIERLCRDGMHITDPLSALMVRKQLIAAVRRALTTTGVKVDSVLVFKGPQGKNKTQFIERLFGAKYVKTNLADIRSKDSVQELKGIWAVEFGELASVNNSDVEVLKEYLSRAVDKYRPSYGRTKIDIPRNCVFFGTTNAASFLKDETGNRRFWIIELSDFIDLSLVDEIRDDVWGEAYTAAMEGEEHWLTGTGAEGAEERTKEFLNLDAWAQLVHDYCIGKTVVRVEDIYQMAICGGDPAAPKTLDARVQARLNRILTIFGAKSGTHRIKGKPMRAWGLPDSFSKEIRVNGHVEVQETSEVQSPVGHNPNSILLEGAEPTPTRRYPSLSKYIKKE